MFSTFPPSHALCSHVEKFWYCQAHAAEYSKERVLPNGRFQIIIDLRDGSSAAAPVVVGMQSKYSVVETQGMQRMIGVLFRPGGAHAWLAMAADEFQDRVVPLDAVWGSAGASLRERLMEAASPVEKFRVLDSMLQERVAIRRPLHKAVAYAIGEFRSASHVRRVLDVTEQTGLSRRRFAQLFREQVGLTPKLYCRINRFQQVVRQMALGEAVDWADVAVGTGYYDQAHLAHEFREFSGISPGSYTPHKQGWMNHVPIE